MSSDFSNIYMGIVYDSLRIMGFKYEDFFINIKPTCGYSRIIHGVAFTTYGEIVNKDITVEEYQKLDKIRLKMYKRENFIQNPIVFLQSNDDKVAHSGDLTSLIYQKLGAAGFITDGNVRDVDIIEKTRFPVFCQDENPIDAWMYWALTKYQIDIEIKNVKISPNDYCFASRDGIIIVKKHIFNDFKKIASEQLERENKIRQVIKNQKGEFDYNKLVWEFGRW